MLQTTIALCQLSKTKKKRRRLQQMKLAMKKVNKIWCEKFIYFSTDGNFAEIKLPCLMNTLSEVVIYD